MSSTASLDGTTVTLYGDRDQIDHALGDQLGRRGCKTHFVSVPTGWLRSATHVVMRLDTAAGAAALRQLATTHHPRSHVIAVCPEQADAAESDRLSEMCRACGAHHDMSLIWHPPFDTGVPAHLGLMHSAIPAATDALATTIADEMSVHVSAAVPSFVARPFVLEPHHD